MCIIKTCKLPTSRRNDNFYRYTVPRWTVDTLDTLCTINRPTSTTPEGVLLAMSLLTIQVINDSLWICNKGCVYFLPLTTFREGGPWAGFGDFTEIFIDNLFSKVFRRLYECLFINVASNSRMNVLHYIGKLVLVFANHFSAVGRHVPNKHSH